MSGTDFTQTPNLSLYKPIYDMDAENWGTHLNSNADTLDKSLLTTGGAMTGALNLTATNSTTSRSVQDRFGEVKNALDYGVKNDGTTDTTNAIRTFIQGGGACYFPPGRYVYNGPYTILHSNTKVFGAGPTSTVFVPGTSLTGGNQDPTFSYIFVNNLYDINGAFTTTPTTPSVQTDINIEISDIGFDMSVAATGTATVNICRMLWAKNVRIRNIRADNYASPSAQSWQGFGFLGCDLYSIENFYARNCVQAVDQWQGNTRAKLSRLWIEQHNPGSNGGVINWNAIGSIHSNGNISDDLQVSDSTFWLNGGIGLYLDTLGGGSMSQNIQLSNLTFSARTGTGSSICQGIVYRGLANRLNAHGISFTAVAGADLQPILLGGYYDPTGSQTSAGGSVTTTNGSSSATVAYSSRSGVGNFVYIDNGAGGPLVGNGLSLQGYYPITAVSGPTSGGSVTGTTLTFTAPNAATASGLIAANTRVPYCFWGAAANVTLRAILIDGCGANGGDLIFAHGQGHIIDGVTVTQNYNGAAAPQYRSVVSIDTTECHGTPAPAGCWVGSISAAQGTGALPAGYVGDNIVQWANAGIAPQGWIRTAPLGDESTTVASTAFAARMLGYSTPAASNGAVYTSASVGNIHVHLIGSLGADASMQFPAGGYQKFWFIRNGTTGGHNTGVVGQGGGTAWIPPGFIAPIWADGVNLALLAPVFNTTRIGDATRNAITLTAGGAPSSVATIGMSGTGGLQFTSNLGFNSATPLAKPTISGACAGNTAIKALLTALANYGLVTDSTTA